MKALAKQEGETWIDARDNEHDDLEDALCASLGFCGCGCPDAALRVVRDTLRLDAMKALEPHEIEEEGHVYPYWRETVPTGEGWQLWQTVSDGPVSPVFETAEALVEWMRGQGYERRQAEAMVKLGSVPSLAICNGRELQPTDMLALKSGGAR